MGFWLIFELFFFTEAMIPLYAFKRPNKVTGKDLAEHECKEPPVAFLDSLVLGEVICKFCWTRI